MTEVLQTASLLHTEQSNCTSTASSSWRIRGFPLCSQLRDYLQAVASPGIPWRTL